MRIPLFLAVAQWVLLLALGLLVIIMYRQLARVFGQQKPASDHGPPVGSKAAAIEYLRLSDDTPRYLTPGGQPTLVAFVEPSCLACDKLVTAISATDDAGELAGLLLMSDPPKYVQVSEAFRSTRQEIGRVMTRATVDAYRAVATPLRWHSRASQPEAEPEDCAARRGGEQRGQPRRSRGRREPRSGIHV